VKAVTDGAHRSVYRDEASRQPTESAMIDAAPLHEPTPEDRLVRDRWARRLAIAYGMALLLLVALVAAHRVSVEPDSSAAVGKAQVSAGHVTPKEMQ
jgi:ferric-dicitrate binding protein FerR (iron transport regulator)